MQFGLTETQQVLKNIGARVLRRRMPDGEVRRLMETDTAYDAPVAARWRNRAGPASSSTRSTAASGWAWWRWRCCWRRWAGAAAGAAILHGGAGRRRDRRDRRVPNDRNRISRRSAMADARATLALLELERELEPHGRPCRICVGRRQPHGREDVRPGCGGGGLSSCASRETDVFVAAAKPPAWQSRRCAAWISRASSIAVDFHNRPRKNRGYRCRGEAL